MPLLLDKSRLCKETFQRLQQFGIPAAAAAASAQPLRIGLLNLMPSAVRISTEVQFFSLFKDSPHIIQPVLIRFTWMPKRGSEHMTQYYSHVKDVQKQGLDGLIVTGANLELAPDGENVLLPFDQIAYYKEFTEILDWAKVNVPSTLFSCLGSHFALKQFYDLDRELGSKAFGPVKTFGVFEHKVDYSSATGTKLLDKVESPLFIPQSRWGNVRTEDLRKIAEVKIVMDNLQSGWNMAIGRNGREIYFQGHPEYEHLDLHGEYMRDKKTGQPIPKNYYPNDDDTKTPVYGWKPFAFRFYQNWAEFLATTRKEKSKL